MRSPDSETAMTRQRSGTPALLLALALASMLPAVAQDAATASSPALAASAAPPETAGDPHARALAVEAAASALRADPLLFGKHKGHVPRWQSEPDKEKKKPDAWPGFDLGIGKWLLSLAGFLSDTSRVLVYGIVLVLATLLLVSLRHLVQMRRLDKSIARAAAVSHVRDLDVRPESLPLDIGAAAWALWQAGDVAAALSLLYRGALSRLIHRFAVPIQSATTEGECLDLARPHVDAPALRYLTQLVRAWEASTYGGRSLSTAMGESLCQGFTSRLDAPANATPAGSEVRA